MRKPLKPWPEVRHVTSTRVPRLTGAEWLSGWGAGQTPGSNPMLGREMVTFLENRCSPLSPAALQVSYNVVPTAFLRLLSCC